MKHNFYTCIVLYVECMIISDICGGWFSCINGINDRSIHFQYAVNILFEVLQTVLHDPLIAYMLSIYML